MRIEGLNVPRTKLIEQAFENDDDFIDLKNDEEYQRERWMFRRKTCPGKE